jgi:predicted nucleotide-binding protein (sugar kinase/HSP70/actin superfamily)
MHSLSDADRISGHLWRMELSNVHLETDGQDFNFLSREMLFAREDLRVLNACVVYTSKPDIRGTARVRVAVRRNLQNDPLSFTLSTKLGFRVQLSPRSSRRIDEFGLESIPSESVCYPGKIARGHTEALLKAGVMFVFYRCAHMERKEDPTAGSHLNCPSVTSYPEVICNHIDAMRQDPSITFMGPFIPIDHKRWLGERIAEELCVCFGLSRSEVFAAADAAWDEQEIFRRDVKEMEMNMLEEIKKRNLCAVVLAGRPHQVDPTINHGILALITSLGLAVLREDSVAHLGTIEQPLRVVDQWVSHTRLYRAAAFVAGQENIELVQLTSFGSGLDAVTSDQIEEMMQAKGCMDTLIKIDDGSNLGAFHIRLRPLIAAMDERHARPISVHSAAFRPKVFTTEMKKDRWTILAPQMSPSISASSVLPSAIAATTPTSCLKPTPTVPISASDSSTTMPAILPLSRSAG